MKNKLPTVLFYFFLTVIFLCEGLGFRGGREVTFYLILIAPFFLFFLDFIQKKAIQIPKKPTILYGLFILFSIVSTIFSVDFQRSFPYLLLYISLFLIFIYVVNHAEGLKQYISPFIFAFSGIFIGYSVIMKLFIQNQLTFFIPDHGYQFVISRFGSHNHLGDFLILPLLIIIYLLLVGKRKILLVSSTLIFFTFLLLSYSRSAYIAFIIVAIFLLTVFYKRSKRIQVTVAIPILLLIIAGLFFFTTVQEGRDVFFLNNLHNALSSDYNLTEKTFLAKRDEFAIDAFQSTMTKPFFGVGPNNYIYISGVYTDLPGNFTYSSHNIFIDTFTENGIPALVFFLAYIYLIMRLAVKRSLYFLLFLALLINFQTDYTFTIFSFFLLFFISGGLMIHKNKDNTRKEYIPDYKISLLLSLTIFFIVHGIYIKILF